VTLPRILTAALFVPLVLAVVWYGSLPFFLFVCGVCLLSIWEYSVMAEEGGYPNQLVIGLLGGLLILLALFFDGAPLGPLHHAPGPLFIFVFWVFVVVFREFFRRDKGHSFLIIITTVTGVVVGALLLGHLILIRELRMAAGEGFQLVGRTLMFFFLAVIWSLDTGAWFVGRLVGRFPMAPVISPKKTWEGALGGTLIACLVGWIFREIYLKGVMGRTEVLTYALLIAVTAQVSDLAESLIKRSFGAKDSSQLLPGHGGILDRFDSFIFAAPFFYYVLVSTGRFQ
jgi:phosphatidate cytidylyltransferase